MPSGPLSAAKSKSGTSATAAPGMDLKPQAYGAGTSLPTIIQIPLLATAGATPRAPRHSVPTLVIPTTTISLSPASVSVPESQGKGSASATGATSNNIQFVVVQQQPASQQQTSPQATLNLMVSAPSTQNLLNTTSEEPQQVESCHLKRKISHAPEGTPDKCPLSYEPQAEEVLKVAEDPMPAMGLFYQDGGGGAGMLPSCTMEQMLVQSVVGSEGPSPTAPQAGFDCDSQWNALAAHQNTQDGQPKPLWGQIASCEPTANDQELEAHASGDVTDVAVASFADEQQFKKQKVKDAPVLSLGSWPGNTLEQQIQSMDFTCVKTEASNWPSTLNGILSQQDTVKAPVVFGDKVILDTGGSTVTTSVPSSNAFAVSGSYKTSSQCQEPVSGGTFAMVTHTFENSSQPASQPQSLDAALSVQREQTAPVQQQPQAGPPQGSNMDHLSAMSMLPESELLRMINPNAFDNV